MIASIKQMLLDGSFQEELIGAMNGLERPLDCQLGFNSEGNIDVVNGVLLDDATCLSLSYLVGSINFLHASLPVTGAGGQGRGLSGEVCRLMIGMLAELSRAGTAEAIAAIVERTGAEKAALRKTFGSVV